MTWEYGRQLAKSTKGSTVLTYEYDVNGIRSKKTTGSESHEYVTLDGKVVRETVKNGTNVTAYIDYLYDNTGRPYKIQVQTGSGIYKGYYVLNQQGDVIGIIDQSGNALVQYSYNAWGVPTVSTNGTTAASNLNTYNALKYRGYYHDKETGFYYVSSRYYDPEVGRFINADDTEYLGADGSLLSYNLFAYCMNNPVNRYDVNGNFSLPNWAKVAIGAVAITGLAVATVCNGGAAAVVCGAALSGAVIGGTSGAVIGAVGGGISGGWKGALDGACSRFMSGTLIGGVSGAASTGLNIATGTTTVVGKAHGSTLHKIATNMEAGKMAASGKYTQIGVNKALKTMGVNGTSRPDVIGIAKSGLNRLVEVVSPRQSTGYIVNKMSRMLSSNAGSSGKIVTWVRNLFR